jgi:uncharacterized lipoprotein YbaY
MRLGVVVRVDPGSPARPPTGADVLVELRDTSRVDAPSTTVASTHGVLPSGDDAALEVTFDVDHGSLAPGTALTVFAQSTADRSGRREKGDWITMESYPVPLGAADEYRSTEVTLRQIR